jgi:hypothetical protein
MRIIKIIPGISILLTYMNLNAQPAGFSLPGEYYLQGVMETASGFKLDSDSTFQFFYSYGALDRFGSGKWVIRDNSVFFTSTQKHDADFALLKSEKKDGDGITVRIIDSIANMLRYVYCIIQSGNEKQQGVANADGTIHFKSQQVDSVTLLFEFCPERETKITIPVKGTNNFEFRFEPWIMEVFFKNFRLQFDEAGLRGGHPILEGNTFSYKKAGNH